ncbi:type I DNA topoisomerase [Candidatus Synechococcus calcipolaris G9]|uniref:DNA topoisomerase 1 n=1 Tax=Candidatus Synechococcus calcipolaris G9 TaxID=1497997 RepID=A0ABT6F0C2_9SYNE|nr:type I DNA topoisomerase [Candidatus Synechococcus calcipolaris]MDG2991290.1 type I DNA topoisomerase [Candidatus Synechococcus calcipolaris G9]
MSTLVIVESPTKARTIRKFLPSDYRVEASMGHVRDLPRSAADIPASYKGQDWANLGVNVANGFEPLYIVPKDKQKVVKELKEALRQADELLLATDEDREGESISWHLLQLLNPKIPVRRMVFHEITNEAIQAALTNCRQVNQQLVRAQETRRILDRLVGYTLSPLLWRKIAPHLSAGRVQSVAVRLLVQRERERLAFHKGQFWDLKATLDKETVLFPARLVSVAGQRVATGSDFDATTGQIRSGRSVLLLTEATATDLRNRLEQETWTVADLEERQQSRKAAPPFTTSTLQQEANRKLHLSAKDTMRLAQKLYEEGYITYMRTDSVHLSDQAIAAARSCVEANYGKPFLSPKPRQFTTKAKGAQEAHEAIRPAGSEFRIPQDTGLAGRELDLYDLIWKRTVATQMADARLTLVNVQIQAADALFRASGKRIDFPGFFRAYVEGSDDPDAALESQEVILPYLQRGDRLACQNLEALGHETQPPARYTEASLVKALESEGIGRPSTYATIISTIQDRDYAMRRGNALEPTFTAFAVTGLLEKNFPDLVDPGFTARMEQTLDDISTGGVKWLPYLEEFYLGAQGLETQVKEREKTIESTEARAIHLPGLEGEVVVGRYGPFVVVQNGDEPVKASLPQDCTPGTLNPEQIEHLIRQKLEGPDKLGLHPDTGEPIFLLTGRFGPYVQLGEATTENPKPKRASLPKGVSAEEVNLDLAVTLLSLPRTLGVQPDTGKLIQANQGRFGPYVVLDPDGEKEYRSLKAEDDLYTISLERALELLAQPKSSRGRSKKQALRVLGNHPEDEQPIQIFDGPYGPYVNHGKVNASLPEGTTVENMTLEQALPLLAEKAPKRKTSRQTSTTKKTTAKKSTTTKKTTRKTSSRKTSSPKDSTKKT